VTGIWERQGGEWRLLDPTGFPDEASLHDRVEEAPQLLPLAGSPRLTILGREVRLGSGWADLLAVERSGRLVVIEVKLGHSDEARRAVVAQILAYASYLYGSTLSDLEGVVLGDHLRRRGFDSIASAVTADDQAGGFDRGEFDAAVAANLDGGNFRLVLVLDKTPEELVQVVAYLGAVTPELVIDLITVSQYDVAGSMILVPHRIEPERKVPGAEDRTPSASAGEAFEGSDEFRAQIAKAPSEAQLQLARMADWADAVAGEGLLNRLTTYRGKSGNVTLLPRLPVEDVGLVTIWYDNTGGYVQWWKSVFERQAPAMLDRLNAVIAPQSVGQGNVYRDVSDALLSDITEAYREAVRNLRGI